MTPAQRLAALSAPVMSSLHIHSCVLMSHPPQSWKQPSPGLESEIYQHSLLPGLEKGRGLRCAGPGPSGMDLGSPGSPAPPSSSRGPAKAPPPGLTPAEVSARLLPHHLASDRTKKRMARHLVEAKRAGCQPTLHVSSQPTVREHL